MRAIAPPLDRSAAMLARRWPMRSTSAPPKKAARTVAVNSQKAVTPVLAGLPVVCSTNQGTAISVRALPVSEMALALKRARGGIRRASMSVLRSSLVRFDRGAVLVCTLRGGIWLAGGTVSGGATLADALGQAARVLLRPLGRELELGNALLDPTQLCFQARTGIVEGDHAVLADVREAVFRPGFQVVEQLACLLAAALELRDQGGTV